jgi:hypothetical protein
MRATESKPSPCSLPSPRLRLAALLALALLGPACGPSGPAVSPAEQSARAVAGIDVRIRGPWTLQSFTPVTPLEPMLKGLVDIQLGRLVVRFDGRRMVADSLGMHVDRAYQISEVLGDQFKLTSFDAQGVPYDCICTFRDANTIDVSSASPPWRGQALVTRGAPLQGPSPW